MNQHEKFRIRLSYLKTSSLIFISHRSLIDVLMRAIRRTQVPLKFTQGFSPRPKVMFSPPLPLGVTGKAELIDIETTKLIDEDNFILLLNKAVPEGLMFTKATNLMPQAPGLSKMIKKAVYTFTPYVKRLKDHIPVEESGSSFPTTSKTTELMNMNEILITKKAKKGKPPKEVNVRPFIFSLEVNDDESGAKNNVETDQNDIKTDQMVTATIASGDKTVSPLILATLLWPELGESPLENVKITREYFLSPIDMKL